MNARLERRIATREQHHRKRVTRGQIWTTGTSISVIFNMFTLLQNNDTISGMFVNKIKPSDSSIQSCVNRELQNGEQKPGAIIGSPVGRSEHSSLRLRKMVGRPFLLGVFSKFYNEELAQYISASFAAIPSEILARVSVNFVLSLPPVVVAVATAAKGGYFESISF
ncbi:hypothetical protein CDAR_179401 [Caerostris darwini]|uniref:Uncharacterized protein n=1 Tax=Caerostris darwini TaxID=1538125 RepID=A0AAV4SH58_9ARAC|nr:hypothetical protein CDAR_179401 [Caerostris darwini]